MASGTRDNLDEQTVNRLRSLTDEPWGVLYKRARVLVCGGFPAAEVALQLGAWQRRGCQGFAGFF